MEAGALQRNRGKAALLALVCAAITLLSLSCGGGGTTQVGSSLAAGFSLSSNQIVFANQNVGSTSTPQLITLTNVGSGVLDLSGVQLTGPDESDFKLTNNCGSSLAASAQCTLLVAFSPNAAGSRIASVVFTDNAAGSPQSLSLTGTGIMLTGISIHPASLSFGTQPVATTSRVQIITLSNTGSTSQSISGHSISGANASDFAEVTDTCGAILAAGNACVIGVTFTPSASGQRTASLNITVNASSSPQAVSFTGTGSPDVILSWGASYSPGVVGYDIYRGSASGGESSTPLNPTPIEGTKYVDENVKAGATYYYVLTSVGADGAQSAHSNETEATVPSS